MLTFVLKMLSTFCFRIPGNKWALEEAKRNLVNNYFVVGVTEELADFVAVLEASLPRFFEGATEYFNSGTNLLSIWLKRKIS